MAVKVRVDGLRELERALSELPKATGKNVLRRVLKKRAEPMASQAESLAPVDTGSLKRSIGVGTKLTRRQSREHRKMFASDKASVEIFVGAGGMPQAHLREFGGDGHPPQAYMRPAWDANKMKILDGLKDDLWTEIRKASERLARKMARLARG